MKKFFLFLMVFAITLFLGRVLAQPVADFVLQENACGPSALVLIENTSNVDACTQSANCLWTITGPSGTVNVPADGVTNFQWTFPEAGMYSVTLVVECGTQTSAPTTYNIEIFESPIASFIVNDDQICVGDEVTFTSTSTPGSSSDITYKWFFGDGNSVEGNYPVYPYTYADSTEPDVTLIITDANECTSVANENNFIQVADPPIISFSATPSSFCGEGPHTADFTSVILTSFNNGVDSYSWSFENGTPSTSDQPNPSVGYSLSGAHNVSLTVIDNFGCTNTFDRLDYIQINEIEAIYSIVNAMTHVYLDDNIVCKGDAYTFINETGLPCTWEFSTGATSSSFSTTQTFNQSGTISVTLTVGEEGCGATETFDIIVEEVMADFTMSASSFTSCGEPITVSFTNNSSLNATSFYWVFGDNTDGSNEENPLPHTYTESGTFQPLLTVTSDHGCSDFAFGDDLVTIHEINPTFTADPMELCVGDNVFFEYTGQPTSDHIVSWTWDFGDGSATSSFPDSTSHIYNTNGDFDATLTVTDDNECTQSTTVSLMVGIVPLYSLDIMEYNSNGSTIEITELVDNNLCPQDSLALYLYEWESLENEYTWWMDSSSNQEANSEYITYAFDQDTGEVFIHVITYNHGCRDTLVIDSFYISAPIIKGIDASYVCGTREFTFTLDTLLASYWDWKIYPSGDPDHPIYEEIHSTQDVITPLILPDVPDEFIVEVIAYNDTTDCEYFKDLTVTITSPLAAFTAPIEDCGHIPISFDAQASQNVIEYKWDFGDGTLTDWMNNAVTTHEFNGVGDFIVILTARDANGCEDTYQQSIHIKGPDIDIAIVDNYACNSFTAEFINHSDAEGGISDILWNFGDNTGFIHNSGENVYHTYLQPGLYTVIVTIFSNNECPPVTDTLPEQIEVVEVSAAFTANPSSACAGVPIQFTATNINPSFEYTWTFNDGTGNESGSSVPHTFLAGGEYSVSLIVDDGIECNDTKTNPVIIQEANAYFTFDDDVLDCISVENAEFNNLSDGLPNLLTTDLTYQWDFGNGDESTAMDPDYYYPLPGIFEVVLTATTSLGCTDTYSDIITLNGPSAAISIYPNEICLGDTVFVQATDTSNVATYSWTMGDGESGLDDPTFTHVYAYPPDLGYYEVSLQIVSIDGCPLIIDAEDPIYVYFSEASITLTNPLGEPLVNFCPPFDGVMSSTSSVNDNTHLWTINGNSFGSGLESENYTFENTTGEDISVVIGLTTTITPYGCESTKDTTITVYALPQISMSADTTICKGDAISIYATGGSIYTWTPDISISDTTIQFPVVNPETDITYLVDVENAHGCHNSDSVHIIVQQDFDVTVTPAIDSIVIGDTVYSVLVATQENLTYTWSPTEFTSCVDCPMPYFIPEESMRYTVTVEDSVQCFRYSYYIDIIVREEYTIDVPGAFTPLSANGNSVVYADGFGIRKLIQFRIYNRWGEEVFYTDDITKGWNGYYNGQLQNIDTYSYYVEAEMFNGTIQSKKGHIMLIR